MLVRIIHSPELGKKKRCVLSLFAWNPIQHLETSFIFWFSDALKSISTFSRLHFQTSAFLDRGRAYRFCIIQLYLPVFLFTKEVMSLPASWSVKIGQLWNYELIVGGRLHYFYFLKSEPFPFQITQNHWNCYCTLYRNKN